MSVVLSYRKLLGTLMDSTTDSTDADLHGDVDGEATQRVVPCKEALKDGINDENMDLKT